MGPDSPARGDLVTLSDLVCKATGPVLALGLLACPALAQDPAAARTPAPIEGTWRTLTGTEINVQPCGAEFCGTFSFIVIPPGKDADACRGMDKTAFATLILDYKNPNQALQTRSLLGLQAVSIKPTNDPNAYTANIYNAEEGKAYDVLLWTRGDRLTLGGGCLGSMCAVTQDWPRVPDRAETPDFSCG
jgi:uncharacterized protein (DUF2147 family)